MGGCAKRLFWSHLYVKCIILPRQAQDKHRENSKKKAFCAVEAALKRILANVQWRAATFPVPEAAMALARQVLHSEPATVSVRVVETCLVFKRETAEITKTGLGQPLETNEDLRAR
jgi:hypothetical protein